MYSNNTFIGLQSNLQNFRFHVKRSVFVSSTFDICKTKAEIKLTSKRGTCINLASEEKRLQNDQPYVLVDILGRVFLGSELGRNQY